MSSLSTSAIYPLFVQALRDIRENRAEYRRECEEYWARGLRAPYCIHGTYLWTDYDPICGYCEAGEQPDTVQAFNMVTGELRRAKYAQDFYDMYNIPEL